MVLYGRMFYCLAEVGTISMCGISLLNTIQEGAGIKYICCLLEPNIAMGFIKKKLKIG